MEKRQFLNSIDELEKIISENTCLLYGAGKVARTIIKYVSRKEYIIEKILVSDLWGNPGDIMGIPVCAMQDYQENIHNKCLIISAMENLHKELEQEVDGFDFRNKYFITDELFRKILYAAEDYEIEQLYELRKIEDMILAQKRNLLRFVPRPCLEYMVLNIVDHCNLKCKGCDHFACIADPYFVAYETIHQDMVRLSEIFHGDYIMQIGVMGGEPLLHPKLPEILADVRKLFPYTTIRLTTNGLLLLKMDEEFWDVCRDNGVIIVNTKYPINLDFRRMKEKAESKGVKFQFFEGTGEHLVKKSFKKAIDLKGNGNPVENFAECHMSNQKNFLMEGKLYGCPFSCQSYRIFNKKFHQELRMTESDFLDIYKVQDMQEIFEFAARPRYYCRYCQGISPMFDWARSRQEISEWVDE